MNVNFLIFVNFIFFVPICMNEKLDGKLSQLRLKSCTDYPTCKLVSLQMFEKYCNRSTLKNMCPTYCISECKPNKNPETSPKSIDSKKEMTKSRPKPEKSVKIKFLKTTTEPLTITTSTITTTTKTVPASTSSFRIYIPKEAKIAQTDSVKNVTSEAPSNYNLCSFLF